MSPILGIYASQISGHLWPASSYESISTVTVGAGGISTVTFSSIPSTYTHLQVRWIARSAGSESTPGGSLMTYAAPHANNFYYHALYGDGSSTASINSGGTSFATLIDYIPGSGATSGIFGTGVFDILDYANTNKIKTFRSLGGFDANGSGTVGLFSGANNDTSVITSLSFAMNSGNNLAQYSSFALYGIKGVA